MVGNNYYVDIVSMKRITICDGLFLLGSKFGWILSGRTQTENPEVTENSMMMLTSTSSQLATQYLDFNKEDAEMIKKPNLEDFWKLDMTGITDTPTVSEDEKAISEFNKSIKLINARYQTRWPWRDEKLELPDNFRLSYGRLKSVMYDGIIKDQLKKDVIKKVDENSTEGDLKHYVPHHGVITPNNTTTKLRIVYDASAKAKKNNISLNECLYHGLVILEDLCALLLRFKTHKIAVVANIEKAFHQVQLTETDRDVTRYPWLKDVFKPITEENLEIFQFTRIPFAVISSPFILGSTICHHLQKENTR